MQDSSGRDFDRELDQADLVVIQFSKQQVLSHQIGFAMDKLMNLSDSAPHVRKFRDKVAFVFEGWDSDPREVFEIPECSQFFQSVARNWPYFFHFIIKDPELLQTMLLLLLPIDTRREAGRLSVLFPSAEQLQKVMTAQFQGMGALHKLHGVGPAEEALLSAQISAALNKMLGVEI